MIEQSVALIKTLKTHRISEENRGLLIDWLVQVFRVLG